MLERGLSYGRKLVAFFNSLSDLAPLAFRLILAFTFYGTAREKIYHFNGVVDWFRDGLQLPLPLLQAYLATGTEALGVILLGLGLATRLISLPLMVVMLVAIFTVHWHNGFSCGKNGYELPFYFFFMLLSLLLQGPGRLSLDHLVASKLSKP